MWRNSRLNAALFRRDICEQIDQRHRDTTGGAALTVMMVVSCIGGTVNNDCVRANRMVRVISVGQDSAHVVTYAVFRHPGMGVWHG